MPYAIIGNVLKMEKTEAKKRIDFLRAEIDRHDRLYYVEARPVIGDRDYDLLYEELLRLERDYPEFYSETSPTQRVSGEPIAGFAQVRHEPPMQSLDTSWAARRWWSSISRRWSACKARRDAWERTGGR